MVAKCSQIFPKIVSKLFRSCSKVAIVSILSQKCPKVVFRNIPNGTQCCPCSSQMVPEGLYWGYHKPTDNWVSAFHLAEVAGIVLAHCCYWRPMWSEKLGRVDQLQVGIVMRAPGGAGNSTYVSNQRLCLIDVLNFQIFLAAMGRISNFQVILFTRMVLCRLYRKFQNFKHDHCLVLNVDTAAHF